MDSQSDSVLLRSRLYLGRCQHFESDDFQGAVTDSVDQRLGEALGSRSGLGQGLASPIGSLESPSRTALGSLGEIDTHGHSGSDVLLAWPMRSDLGLDWLSLFLWLFLRGSLHPPLLSGERPCVARECYN